jgi:hypothetical protein
MHNESETTDEALLDELDEIDGERAERSSGSTVKQRKARSTYMRLYRSRLNNPQKKIESQWADNLEKLPEAERKRLLDAADEASFLNRLIALVDRGVGYCGVGIGEVDKDFPDPNVVREEIQSWLDAGNTLLSCEIPRSMVGLFPDELYKTDDKEFRDYGLRVHVSPSTWEHFLKNLRKFNRRQKGESTIRDTSFVQTILQKTEKEEADQLEKHIRKQVGL